MLLLDFLCNFFLFFYIVILEQMNNLQWTLASVPLIKALQLALSFLFW